MPSDTRHNGHASDTTSAKPAAKLSETDYLAREADDARGAISKTIGNMRTSLAEAADVRAWARKYPWATLGAATAAGFLAAGALMPRRGTVEDEDEPGLVERILADEQIAERIKTLAKEDENGIRKRPSVLRSVAATLLETFGPAIQQSIATALAARATTPGPEEGAKATEQEGDE